MKNDVHEDNGEVVLGFFKTTGFLRGVSVYATTKRLVAKRAKLTETGWVLHLTSLFLATLLGGLDFRFQPWVILGIFILVIVYLLWFRRAGRRHRLPTLSEVDSGTKLKE